MTPYEILGIPPDATSEEIKAAYRAQAQRWHPDKEGGDAETFKTIKAAYEELSGEPVPDNTKAEMLERVQQLFMAAVDGPMGATGNPVNGVIKACLRVQQDLQAHIAQTAQAIHKREQVLKRIRGKTPEATVLQNFIKLDIARHKASIASLELEVPKAQAIIDFMKDYDYEEDGELGHFGVLRSAGLLGNWPA